MSATVPIKRRGAMMQATTIPRVINACCQPGNGLVERRLERHRKVKQILRPEQEEKADDENDAGEHEQPDPEIPGVTAHRSISVKPIMPPRG